MPRLRLGVLYDFRNPARWARAATSLYHALLDQIASLESLGFDAVWLTEHHFIPDGYLPAPFALAGAVATRTSRLTIGTNVLLLPLHHPVPVAENAAVLDVLSGGRFVLGVGLGYRAEEFQAYGVPRSERGARMEEALSVLRRCWAAEGPFDFEGRHYNLCGVDVQPRPVQPGGVPIWVGARGDKAIDRAARLGDGWIAAGAARAEYDAYTAACERHGRAPGTVGVVKNVWVGGWDEVEPFARYLQDNYRRWYGEAADLAVDTAEVATHERYPLPLDWYLVGDPAFVADELERYRAEVPVDHLMLVMHYPGMDPAQSGAAIRRFAEQVIPRLS